MTGEFCTCQLSAIAAIKVTGAGFLSSDFLREEEGNKGNLKAKNQHSVP
jgi:hypothetical protein